LPFPPFTPLLPSPAVFAGVRERGAGVVRRSFVVAVHPYPRTLGEEYRG